MTSTQRPQKTLLGKLSRVWQHSIGMTRRLLQLLSVNFWQILWFELFFKASICVVVLTQISGVLRLLMKVEHYPFITWELLPKFLTQPASLVAIALLLCVAALLSTFEVSVIFRLLAAARRRKSLPLRRAMLAALRELPRTLLPKNILIAVYMLLVAPLMSAPTLLVGLRIFATPELLVEWAFEHRMATGLMSLAAVLICMVWVGLAYCYPYYIFQAETFVGACKKSLATSRGRIASNFVRVLLVKLLLDGVGLAFVGVLIAKLSELYAAGQDLVWATYIQVGLLLAGVVMAVGVQAVLSMPCALALIADRWWALPTSTTRTQSVSRASQMSEAMHTHYVSVAISAALIASLMTTAVWGVKEVLEGSIEVGQTGPAPVSVTAHRGASNAYPENTMPAFRAAALEHADWIELDVQQSADGVIFVSHDSNFLRISGVDKNCWEMSYAQIAKLDARGSGYEKTWDKLRYPRLKEVVRWAKMSGQHLNIELKPTGHDRGFEQVVIQIVRDFGYEDHVLLTSQNYACVERLKELAPDIKRAYVTNFVYGDVEALDAMDVWSVKATSCTQSFVHYVHETEKPVLAWTVNDEPAMLRAINNGVDGIITNDVKLGQKAVADSADTATLRSLIDLGMLILFG